MSDKRKRVQYEFGPQGGERLGLNIYVSQEEFDRILVMCNAVEMKMATLCRHLVLKSIREMEGKLEEYKGKDRAGKPYRKDFL